MSDAQISAIVFDVNETLIDLEHLTPLFARIFGDPGVMREWFAQVVLYSQAVTLAEKYVPFGAIGAGVFRMVGAIHRVEITSRDVEELTSRTSTMPAHPDVAPTLERLRNAGFRLATLTNSAPQPDGGPLQHADLARFFEERCSVDTVQRFKPAPETYGAAAVALDLPPERICLVAAHVWDTLGAQAAHMKGALVLRPGNAELPLDGIPAPDLVASDLVTLADLMIAAWR